MQQAIQLRSNARTEVCHFCNSMFVGPTGWNGYCHNCITSFMPGSAKKKPLQEFINASETLPQLENLLANFVDSVGDLAFEMTCGELTIFLLVCSRDNPMQSIVCVEN